MWSVAVPANDIFHPIPPFSMSYYVLYRTFSNYPCIVVVGSIFRLLFFCVRQLVSLFSFVFDLCITGNQCRLSLETVLWIPCLSMMAVSGVADRVLKGLTGFDFTFVRGAFTRRDDSVIFASGLSINTCFLALIFGARRTVLYRFFFQQARAVASFLPFSLTENIQMLNRRTNWLQQYCSGVFCVMPSSIVQSLFAVVRPSGWQESTNLNGVVPAKQYTCVLYAYVSGRTYPFSLMRGFIVSEELPGCSVEELHLFIGLWVICP